MKSKVLLTRENGSKFLESSSKADSLPSELTCSPGAMALHGIEKDLKAITERVAALRFALLRQDSAPNDLLSLLSSRSNVFLTVQELSDILNVEKRTIYGLRNQGLPFHRIGKELRFDPLEVARWLKERHQTR